MNRLYGVACAAAGLFMASPSPAADSWQSVTTESQPLLPGNEIQFIKPGATEGQLWLGTLTGAASIEKGVIRPLEQAKGLRVWDVTARPGGGFWIGHADGVRWVDGDRVVDTLKGVIGASIQPVGDQIWLLAQHASNDRSVMMRAVGDTWEEVPELKGYHVLDFTRDSKGVVWVVLDGNGVLEIDSAKGVQDLKHHLPRMNVTSILTDPKGNTWCGLMHGGIVVRRNGEWKSMLDAERSAILSMAEDAAGSIWAATSGNGVWVFDGKAWKGLLQEEGAVNLLKVTSDKRVWVSTQRSGGLRYWNGAEWTTSLDGPLPIRCMAELPNVALIAGGVLDGLHILGNYSIKGE